MARQMIVKMTDDFDRETPADEVIEFGWEGFDYILDLTTEHADEFRALIQPYVDAAHGKLKQPKRPRRKQDLLPGPVPSPAANSPSSDAKQKRERGRQIRAWARDNGYQVSARGVLPAEIEEAYEKATNA
ncbi:Lsr2-like DNA bridging protein [Mycobacterium phage Estes]|uniref:Lsr2-like DNA bridging protein n=2 Tax=Reyvirus TaxID=1623301 RepID=A0A7G9A274_9CAUD|nr:nucloid associated Lsr2-like [Mycobacterium phage Estes]YP_010013910.1 nucloid associated Lsr2-like [Mycobacterium phage MrMagoo]APQ42109.1 Lsr2-like DNA bridging protein [Mycobacterium phage MrMagoo]ARM70186.1 Lsr2-like DNA bridging protein [Mycobacterium phage GardenSalsa]QNL30713.1 Lsr2-like DNA bridging protein [Mycobacterium phage Estes]